MRETYEIPVSRLEELKERMAKVNKVAAKLGCEPVKLIEGDEIVRDHPEDGRKPEHLRRKVKLIAVTIEGETPMVKGYSFRATLLHTYGEDAGTIILAVPGYSKDLPPQYREASASCDHCGYTRKRKKTYVMQHEDGTWIQVGSTCIADFLDGAHDPARVASLCEGLGKLVSFCRTAAREPGENTEPMFDLVGYLGIVIAVVREHGWVSKSSARRGGGTATVARVDERLFGDKRGEGGLLYTDEDKARAEGIAAWMENLGEREDLNDYMHNLSVIGAAGYVDMKTSALASSAPAAFARETDDSKPVTVPRGGNSYFGTLGQRDAFVLTVTRVGEFDGRYGHTWVVGFADADGNEGVWFASRDPQVARGDRCSVTGTVKKHGTFRGTKQTTLSRCKVKVLRRAA